MGLDPASTVVSCGGSFTSRKLLLSLMTVSLVFLVAASCDDKDPKTPKPIEPPKLLPLIVGRSALMAHAIILTSNYTNGTPRTQTELATTL